MQEQKQGHASKKLPTVGFKKLKKTLKRCRRHGDGIDGDCDDDNNSTNNVDNCNPTNCLQHCPGEIRFDFISVFYRVIMFVFNFIECI